MLTRTGSVKVLDFGLAKIETAETATKLTGAGTRWARPPTCRPNRRPVEVVDARSDLWSLGVVTYEMLAGRRRSRARTRWRHPRRADDHACASQDVAARRRPGAGRDREPDDGARSRSAHDHGGRGARSRLGLHARLSSGALRPVARPRTSRRVRLAAGGRRARRRRQWRRVVGAAQREGPLGAAGGAAGDHQAGRRGQVRRGV